MIRVACPHCGRTFRTMTEGMGKVAVCSGCRESFRIGTARPKFAWKPNDLAEDSWVGVEPPSEKKEIKHCIICQAPLEDDAIRCMACGANQITGVVHKTRPKPAADERASIWSLLPWRLIAVLAFAVLGALGLFWAARGLFTSVAEEGVEMARVRLIKAAALQAAAWADQDEFAGKFAGQINDENLPRFVEMLGAGDPMIRRAAPLLIACGKVTQVGPVVAKARDKDEVISQGAIGVLQAIGPRRLVELSGHADASIRRSAAEALCVMFDIEAGEETLERLSNKTETGEKIQQLNELCRPWPRAVGEFTVSVDGQPAPMTASIEQIGRTFYLQIGTRVLVSQFDAERTFVIPVERWCAATGVAVDPVQVRELARGAITLTSEFGTNWKGEARVTAVKDLDSPLPGFLPTGKLRREEVVTLPISLDH